MSSFRRVASGTAATMSTILVGLAAQILLVPFFLTYWDAQTYGIWLAIQAAVPLIALVDVAYQDYIFFECLRAPQEDRQTRRQIFSDAWPTLLLVGIGQFAVVIAIFRFGAAGHLLGGAADAADLEQAETAMLVLLLAWILFQKTLGMVGRVLGSVGYYARNAWWGVASAIASAGGPVIALVLGYGLVGVASAQAIAIGVFAAIQFRDHRRTLAKAQIHFVRPHLRAGLRRFGHAMTLALVNLLETLQQTGFRLVVLPFLGPAGLIRFSTLRTIANVAQQGLGTLAGPIMPELMQVVAARDAPRVHASLSLMWLVLVQLMAPAFVLLQLVAPSVYETWTLGKLAFDAPAFALLSATVMLFALAQPARAIVRGNNLLREQLMASIIASAVVLATTWIAVPPIGIAGAALALVLGELTRLVVQSLQARRWLDANGMTFPLRAIALASATTAMTIAAMIAIALGGRIAEAATISFALAWIVAITLAWRALPAQARAMVRTGMASLPWRAAHPRAKG